MEGIICLINTGMQASNIQSKQAHRKPLHCESCEAKDAIEGGMQESPTLWIKASMSEANTQSKDVSQACIKRGQKANRRRWIKEDLFFSNFVKNIIFIYFPFFNSFLFSLMLKNPIVLVQAWILRIIVRNALRNERENFGVQELPLFNLLKSDGLDWQVRHSWSEGRRGLNT